MTSLVHTIKPTAALIDGVQIQYRETCTVIRSKALQYRVELPQATYLAAGSIRGGSSILGYMLRSIGLIDGENIHPTTHEDLDFERAQGRAEWKVLIGARNRTYDHWALKLPIIAKNLRFFEHQTRNPIFLMIVRNPIDLAFSIMKKDARFPASMNGLASAYDAGNEYYANFFAALETVQSPIILVNKESVAQHPESFVRDFCELMNYKATESEVCTMVKGISTTGYKLMEKS